MTANEKLSQHYEREAELTRNSLASSLNELNERLSPGQVFDEVLTYAKGGGNTFAQAFTHAVRDNPMPSLLIGAGCMMFLSEKMGITGNKTNGRYKAEISPVLGLDEQSPGIGQVAKEKVSQATESVKHGISAASETIGGTVERAQETVQEMREGVSETLGQMKQGTKNVQQNIANKATRSGEQAMNVGRQVKDRTTTFLYDQPIVAAGIGLAVGAVIAALLPATRVEDELMGETSDSVKQKLGDTAAQQFDSVKESAGEFVDKAKNIAEREGLTSAGIATDIVRKLDGKRAKESTAPPYAAEGWPNESDTTK